MRRGRVFVVAVCLAVSGSVEAAGLQRQSAAAAETPGSSEQALLKRYCITCHNDHLKTGGLSLDSVDVSNVGEQCRGVGEGRPQAPGGRDAAGGPPASGRGDRRALCDVA